MRRAGGAGAPASLQPSHSSVSLRAHGGTGHVPRSPIRCNSATIALAEDSQHADRWTPTRTANESLPATGDRPADQAGRIGSGLPGSPMDVARPGPGVSPARGTLLVSGAQAGRPRRIAL